VCEQADFVIQKSAWFEYSEKNRPASIVYVPWTPGGNPAVGSPIVKFQSLIRQAARSGVEPMVMFTLNTFCIGSTNVVGLAFGLQSFSARIELMHPSARLPHCQHSYRETGLRREVTWTISETTIASVELLRI